MNRIDRLNAVRILLEGRRLITAQEISEHFGLSLRTVYRDIRSLQEAGVSIEGEAGMGYRLSRKAQLRPISFDSSEALSLLMASKVMEGRLDSYHTRVFHSAIGKIRTALPDQDKDQLERLEHKIALPANDNSYHGTLDPEVLHPIQNALANNHHLEIHYSAQYNGKTQQRSVIPIGILYYGGYWHMIAWCLLRQDYRDFRIDRILQLRNLGNYSLKKKLKSLDDYLKEMTQSSSEKSGEFTKLYECVVRFSPQLYSLYERTRFKFGFVRQHNLESGKYLGWVQATFYVDHIAEFARWILGFTTDAYPLSPPDLIQAYQGHLKSLKSLLT